MPTEDPKKLFANFAPFVPLIFAYLLLTMFYLTWCVIGPTDLDFTVPSNSADNPLLAGRSTYAKYLTATTFILLVVTELAVIIFSICSIQHRTSLVNYHSTIKHYWFPFLVLFTVSFSTFTLLQAICGHALYPVNALGRRLIGDLIGVELLRLLDWSVNVSGFLAFLATAAIFTAACTLNRPMSMKFENDDIEDVTTHHVEVARTANKLRWMRYYLFFSALLLTAGILFLKTWTAMPIAYFGADDSNLAMVFKTAADGIVLFNACFYVLLLLVVFFPIIFGLLRDGSRLADVELRSNEDGDRTSWMRTNQLSLSMSQTIQSVVALFGPLIVALLNELLVGLF